MIPSCKSTLCLKSSKSEDFCQVDQAYLVSCLASKYKGLRFWPVTLINVLHASLIEYSLIPPKLIISPIQFSFCDAFQKGITESST